MRIVIAGGTGTVGRHIAEPTGPSSRCRYLAVSVERSATELSLPVRQPHSAR